ncbi:MAG: right-handed parallel beta-helix repeat-containing protein, partial [Acholeplasma sp.]|nr:right-handed parallel beta-helix repeat-containing protein [Acholeplasma sp.]
MQSVKKVEGGLLKGKLNFKFKKTFTLGFFALAFFVFGIGFGKDASAATYYVRADGTVTAANKANATSPTDANTALNMAQVNASTFMAGDSIFFSSQGGNYTTTLIIPSSGNIGIGNQISYSSVNGENPTINNADVSSISINAKSNIVISGFTINNSSNIDYAKAISISGIVDNITLQSISAVVSNSAHRYILTASGISSNIILDGIYGSGANQNSIYFYGSSNSNITIKNAAITGGRQIYIINTQNITISNTISNDSLWAGVYLYNCSGILNIDDLNVNNSVSSGLAIDASNFLDGSTIINSSVSNSTSYGYAFASSSGFSVVSSNTFRTSGFHCTTCHDITFNLCESDEARGAGFWANNGSYNIIYNNCIAKNGLSDGFGVTDEDSSISHDIYYNKCLAYNNGNKLTTAGGDGFTSHLQNYNIFVNNSIAYNNTCSGYAMVGESAGHIYNSIAANNAGDWSLEGGLDQVRAGYYVYTNNFDIKNSIGYNNYPRELLIGSDTILNYNLYSPLSDSQFARVSGVNNSWSEYFSRESNSLNSNPLFFTSNNFNLQYNSPAIDSGTSVNLTSDFAGNPIYGAPDIGAYEYQPPHLMGTDKIDIAAGARIYGDGKFRDLNATSSQLADLTITPQSESFETYESDEVRPEWLNITDITWSNTKEWTESSEISGLTNTLHTVGDLTPNKYYNISVDNVLGQNITGTNCTAGICKADSNGKIAFTYTGTYSEHTFKVESGDNSNPTLTNNTNNKFTTDTTSITLNLTTDENSTCHYSNNSTSIFDDATTFDITGETNHSSQINNLVSGEYTYYAICRDSNNNESTYTLEFEIAPSEAKESLSTPIIKTSEGKEKMKSGFTIRSDSKEIKLQGEDIKLANG